MSNIPGKNPPGVYECFIDGSCAQNPGGRMGQGVVIRKDELLAKYYDKQEPNSGNSNNVSEYLALLLLLSKIKDRKNKVFRIYTDSMLVASQISGEWQIGDGLYREYAFKAMSEYLKLCENNDVKIYWIRKELNTEAIHLSNH